MPPPRSGDIVPPAARELVLSLYSLHHDNVFGLWYDGAAAEKWKLRRRSLLTCYSRPLVLHVLAPTWAFGAEGEGDAVALRHLYVAVGLERDMMEGRVARDKRRSNFCENNTRDGVAEGITAMFSS